MRFWHSLTRSLPQSFQKQELLCIKVRTFFGGNNFRNTWTQFGSKWWKPRIKALLSTFKEFLELVNRINAKGFSETSPLLPSFESVSSAILDLWGSLYFFENIRNLMQIFKSFQKKVKNFMVFYITWFQLVTVNSLYYWENTQGWHPVCYQAVLKSQIRLKINFSNSI